METYCKMLPYYHIKYMKQLIKIHLSCTPDWWGVLFQCLLALFLV